MKAKRFFSPIILLFVLCLCGSLTACQDNDLSENSTATDTETAAQQKAETYEALSCLLGGLASVDSLPSNWQDANYAVEPTVGDVVDEGTPFVRYVVTSSAEEADRIYRSYISANVSGEATNDTWTKEGIGQLNFKVLNQADAYATLDVNVKQLPHLEQIRFVPSSAIGDNGGLLKPAGTYYQFGDVVRQYLPVEKKYIYWVCVRPCSMEEKLRKTHWCSLQMVRQGEDANYKKVDKNCLPTKLCSSQSDGERFVQNYFNVLRLIANPDYAKGKDNANYTEGSAKKDKYQGIDNIKAQYIPYDSLRDISYLWDCYDLWNKDAEKSIVNKGYTQEIPLRDVVSASTPNINAFYYGYKTVFWGKGDYRVFNLNLQVNSNNSNPTLFNQVEKTTPLVQKTDFFDFTDFERGGTSRFQLYSDEKKRENNQFIVRYKTGAELEGKTGVDEDPAHSFSERFTQNKLEDVLVSRKLFKVQPTAANELPAFFAFGDEVTKTKDYDGYQFCIREANQKYNYLNKKDYALFVGCPANERRDDEEENVEEKNYANAASVYDRLAEVVLYHFMAACAQHEGREFESTNVLMSYWGKKNFANYKEALDRLYNKVLNGNVDFYINDVGDYMYVKARLNNKVYKLTYNINGKTISLDETSKEDEVKAYNKIQIFQCIDNYTYKESYSIARNLIVKNLDERNALKTKMFLLLSKLIKF